MLVVRPADPARCNGTAVVHWLNVTAGYEKGTADDEELLSGFVWVGVSAQQVGIDGRAPGTPTSPGRGLPGDPLKTWDPQRYGSLVHPGDEFSYDIFSQAGVVIRSGAVTGGVAVDRLVATGPSQSGASPHDLLQRGAPARAGVRRVHADDHRGRWHRPRSGSSRCAALRHLAAPHPRRLP